MDRFRFRLERVLGLRVKEQKQSEELLREELRKLHESQRELESLLTRYDEALLPSEGGAEFSEFQLACHYRDLLKALLEVQKVVLEEAEAAVERARADYIEKSRGVKTLELLKEKRLEEYSLERKRAERKTQDERSAQQVGVRQRLTRVKG